MCQSLLASIAPKHHPEMVKMILKAAAILHLHLAPSLSRSQISILGAWVMLRLCCAVPAAEAGVPGPASS